MSHNTLLFNRQGNYFCSGFGEAEAVVEAQADDPDDATIGIDGHVDVAFFYNVQLLVFEEVADKAAAAHAEGVEAVGGLPRTDGEGKTDTGSVDILDLRVADSRGLRHGSHGECWSHNGCQRSDDEAVAVDDGFVG